MSEKSRTSASLLQNTVYSLLTQFVPLGVALLVIARLIDRLGTDRFGVLALSWVFLRYFAIFDLGLGRATTKYVAEYLAREKHGETPSLVWTSWFLLFCLGLGAGLLFYLLIPILVERALNIPMELVEEVRRTFIWVASSIPLVIYAAGIRAVLEAHQRFRDIALVMTPESTLRYLVALLASSCTHRLDVIFLLLFLNRALFIGIYVWRCLKSVPELRKPRWPDSSLLSPLMRFGGWLTVSNLLSPLMSYFDRFWVASFISLSAVTYYTTPYEMLQKVELAPFSLMNVLFPAFSSLNAADLAESSKLFHRAVRLLFLSLLPVTVLLMTMSEDILRIWIDADFAVHSAPILRWLAPGMLVNTLAMVPYNWMQSAGRADMPARFHLLELPLYLILLWRLSATLGIVGVAIAWVARVAVDAVLLFRAVAGRLAPRHQSFEYFVTLLFLGVGLYLAYTILIAATTSTPMRVGFAIAITLIYVVVVWRWFVKPDEKHHIVGRIVG